MCGTLFVVGSPVSLAGVSLGIVSRRGPDAQSWDWFPWAASQHRAVFGAAVLGLRGTAGSCTHQPVVDNLTGWRIAFNGEVYATKRRTLSPDANDTGEFAKAFLRAGPPPAATATREEQEEWLRRISESLAELDGPYAFVAVHRATGLVTFGKDPVGRRSLVAQVSDPAAQDATPTRAWAWAVGSAAGVPCAHAARWVEVPIGGVFACWPASGGSRPAAYDSPAGRLPETGRLSPSLAPVVSEFVRGMRRAAHSPAARFAPWPCTARHSYSPSVDVPRVPSAQESLAPLCPREAAVAARLNAASAAPHGTVRVLRALSHAVRTRVALIHRSERPSPASAPTIGGSPSCIRGSLYAGPAAVGILFSGGLDSAIVATLADWHVPADEPIDLLSVCFRADAPSPDRVTAIATAVELATKVAPHRCWRLVAVPGRYDAETAARMRRLLLPCDTIMDASIGTALRAAASGAGCLVDISAQIDSTMTEALYWADSARAARQPKTGRRGRKAKRGTGPKPRVADLGRDPNRHPLEAATARVRQTAGPSFATSARVLLSGLGADELAAGYSSHREAHRVGGAEAVAEELSRHVERLWTRNLGRDDRAIADCGREARFPFLDPAVARALETVPFREIADLSLPRGEGDKLIFRRIARAIGLVTPASLAKRAIQFGTRAARAQADAAGTSKTKQRGTQRM